MSKRRTTQQGVYVERRYTYLTPALWQAAHRLSMAAGSMSVSHYLSQLVEAADNNSSSSKAVY